MSKQSEEKRTDSNASLHKGSKNDVQDVSEETLDEIVGGTVGKGRAITKIVQKVGYVATHGIDLKQIATVLKERPEQQRIDQWGGAKGKFVDIKSNER